MFEKLKPQHLLDLVPQASQQLQYGLPVDDISWDEAAALAEQDNCWSAIGDDGKILACLGVNETFPGVQGVSWAFFAENLGREMVPITQFAREVVIGLSPLRRIEAIVRCEEMPDWLEEERLPEIRASVAVAWAMRHATPQVSWAIKVGLDPVAVLRAFGAAGEAHMLLELVRSDRKAG